MREELSFTRRRFLARALAATITPVSLSAFACDVEDRKKVAGKAEDTAKEVATTVADYLSSLVITAAPVTNQVKSINWYGNTELALLHRRDWYGEVQGFHSGVDWLVPIGTTVTTGVASEGKVISVDGVPFGWGAAPNAVAVDYGRFIVLYGHLSKAEVSVGLKTKLSTVVGRSGTGQGTEHLHLEVIHKDDSVPSGQRPGNIRTNPVKFMAPAVREKMASQAWDTFHKNASNRWLNELDQPDIYPGESLFFP